jgi:phenylacetate-CoA ligase
MVIVSVPGTNPGLAPPRRTFYPVLEGLSRQELQSLQLKKLQFHVERLYQTNPFYRERWQRAGVRPDQIRTLADIKRLPQISKQDLIADQEAVPPYGLRLGVPADRVWEITMSSGTSGKGQELHAFTVRDAHMRGALNAIAWAWAGAGRHDATIFHIGATNSASIGCMMRGERAAARLPYLVGHAGFDERLQLMLHMGLDAMYCMPSALNGLSLLCEQRGVDPKQAWPNLKFIMTSAEPWPVEWVQRIEAFWGARVFEEYGSTQTMSTFGMTNCEKGAVTDGKRGSLHFFEWSFLYEVVNPETGEAVQPGEEGELVVTHLDKEASPLVRFGTRDRMRWFPHTACTCGRQLDFAESGTVGRWDDMLKIKGVNIWPHEVDQIVLAHAELDEYQARIFIGEKARDEVELRYAFKPQAGGPGFDRAAFGGALIEEIKQAIGITVRAREVSPDDLPHFITPDKKSRRWTDERQAGLARGFSAGGAHP